MQAVSIQKCMSYNIIISIIVTGYKTIIVWKKYRIFCCLSFFISLSRSGSDYYLSAFSWRSVIRLRSFLFVYGTIALDSFSCCSPPLNGKVRLPFELCSSPADESIFLKLCYKNNEYMLLFSLKMCNLFRIFFLWICNRLFTWIGLEMNVYVIGSGDCRISLLCNSCT